MKTKVSGRRAANAYSVEPLNMDKENDASVPSINQTELASSGWTSFDLPVTEKSDIRGSLLTAAAQLGTVSRHQNTYPVDTLRPKEGVNVRTNSLSGKYALGAFPCHTDMAHLLVPSRYILLGCVNPGDGDRETILLNACDLPLTSEQRQLLTLTPFRVKNGRQSFFSTVIQMGRPFIRYDRGCMQPLSLKGALALSYLDSEAWPSYTRRVGWERGRILVIDNWRILHGRGCSFRSDTSRELLRLYVD
jgi:hypothetical protein